jgi:hypothetical protein
MRVEVLAVAVAIAACNASATQSSVHDGALDSSPGATDGPLEAATPGTECGDHSYFTACVKQCGEKNDREPVSAECVDGSYRCGATLIPATACGAGSWTVPRLPCGPWVDGYDCGVGCAVCDPAHGWTCGECPDASSSGGG